MTRRRTTLFGALVLAAGLVVGGCSQPSNAPTEFDSQTQANFMATCTGNWEGSGTTLASSDTCECAYTAVTGYYGGTEGFTQFSELDQKLRSDPNAMPQDLKDQMAACPGWPGGSENQATTTTSIPSAAPTAPTGTGTSGTSEP